MQKGEQGLAVLESKEPEKQRHGLYIKTYGCQMNLYDSERMADILAPMGFHLQTEADGADMIVLNTCHIREKAAEKLYSDLGRFRRMHPVTDPQAPILAVAGCVAQAEGEEVLRRAPGVDIVIGPQIYHELPEMVDRVLRERKGQTHGKTRLINTEFPEVSKFDHLPKTRTPNGPSAFLSIQEGCDKFCAFCVVPYTRGAEYSRPAADILEEVRALLDSGAREIVLLGQNVNAWNGDWSNIDQASLPPSDVQNGFAKLLHTVSSYGRRDGRLMRLRYTTSHPKDMSYDLIQAHGALSELPPSLHLPVQSGSDRVLEVMNRKHTRADYLKIIENLKAAKSGISLTSDFIVGFPGESEEDFADTLSLVEEVGYAMAYSFKYSRRPGTPGARAQGQIREEVKSKRLAKLQDILNASAHHFNAQFIGKEVEVLLERPGKRQGQLVGKTPHNVSVPVDIPSHLSGDGGINIGSSVKVEVTASSAHSLSGKLIT